MILSLFKFQPKWPINIWQVIKPNIFTYSFLTYIINVWCGNKEIKIIDFFCLFYWVSQKYFYRVCDVNLQCQWWVWAFKWRRMGISNTKAHCHQIDWAIFVALLELKVNLLNATFSDIFVCFLNSLFVLTLNA